MATREHFYQQLFGSNSSLNIAEELSARIKDPLWFLSRQWQSGEFEAENGGRAAGLAFETRSNELATLTFPDFSGLPAAERSVEIDGVVPLEALVEAEVAGVSAAWHSQALEYRFELATAGHVLRATEYHGNALDWFHFDLAKTTSMAASATKVEKLDVIPTQINFAGAPDPRWWSFEEGDGYFDAPRDADPNALSLLIPEFFYADINNWYIAPVELPAGSVAEVADLSVTDSFGHVTKLARVSDPDFALFELDAESGDARGMLLLPNVALDILHNDEVEDVRFIRDEGANMVWAVERIYTDFSGHKVNQGDGVVGASPPAALQQGSLPEFKLATQTPPHWIPYVPRKPNTAGAPQGDMYLRRGRTIETASQANPQYRSQVVLESVRVNEEEVPRTGLRVRRVKRYARGSDGIGHFWIGRVRDSGRMVPRSGLEFDILKGFE